MMEPEPKRPIGTVTRVVELIRYLAEHGNEVAVTTIARDLWLPPSTVHRLLHLLMEQGFVERGMRFQNYCVGPELFRLSSLISRKMALAELADPVMKRMSAESGEFSMLCLYLPTEHSLTLVHTVAAAHPLTYNAEMFTPMSIAWGASGRAILASLSENEIREIYQETGPSPVTGEVLPPYPQFRADLQTVKEQGYARTRGQKIAGAVGLASPVRGASGKVVASLCLTVPEFRFDPSVEPRLGALLKRCAATLSHARGHAPTSPTPRVFAPS